MIFEKLSQTANKRKKCQFILSFHKTPISWSYYRVCACSPKNLVEHCQVLCETNICSHRARWIISRENLKQTYKNFRSQWASCSRIYWLGKTFLFFSADVEYTHTRDTHFCEHKHVCRIAWMIKSIHSYEYDLWVYALEGIATLPLNDSWYRT